MPRVAIVMQTVKFLRVLAIGSDLVVAYTIVLVYSELDALPFHYLLLCRNNPASTLFPTSITSLSQAKMLQLIISAMLGGLLFLIALASWCYTFRKPTENQVKQAELLPGWTSQPSHPELGDLGVALSCGSLYSFLQQRHKEEASPIFAFWWNTTKVVSICTPQSFKETENLYNRPHQVFRANFEPLHGAQSIQSINDSEWEDRKRLVHKTIRGDNVVTFIDEFEKIAKDSCFVLIPGTEIELTKTTQTMTLKAILNTSLGNVFEDDSGVQWLANTYHLCKCEMDKRFLDVPDKNSTREVGFQNRLQQIKECMYKIRKFHREQRFSKALPFLDTLLSSELPEDHIISDMITILGGFHTSAYYLTWTLLYLADHPNVQSKLVSEIKERVEEGNMEQFKSYVLSSSSYLRQVLDESLRFSITVPQSGHYCNHDIEVEGYVVPAKTPIIQCLGVAMTDESIWESPRSFKPERFSAGTKAALRGREFRPFGISNLRRCPANQFTYTMVSVFVCTLIKKFVLNRASEGAMEKTHGIATSPKGKMYMSVQYRK